MYPDLKKLLSVLNAHGVRYLVIGAYAVSIYAQPRATEDLDILVKADAENAERVFSALAKFGAPLHGLRPADFAEPGPFFRMDANRSALTFSRRYPELSLMRCGRAGLRLSWTPPAA